MPPEADAREKCKQCAAEKDSPEMTKPGSGETDFRALRPVPDRAVFRGSRRVWSLPLEATIAPFVPQAKIKSKCQQPMESKASAEFAFPFLWQAPATCRQIHYICARVGLPGFLHFISP
jgi:hypothetical protein